VLLRFTKMHGLGNDFVVIDAVSQDVQIKPHLARRLANRRLGVGCDQILVVEPPSEPDVDFTYRIFNADGSEVSQCGNGARCFAKFVRDRKLTGKRHIRVATRAGILSLTVNPDNQIRVEMGVPVFSPEDIPLVAGSESPLYSLDVGGQQLSVAALSMGNPHAVMLVNDVSTAAVESLGPLIESHERFPERVNAGFMAVCDRHEIDLRVYERGAGETLACGSGACAAAVAGIRQDLLDSPVDVHLPGGTLRIEWAGDGQQVVMTGPATTVFHGRIRL